jgi:Transposase DDE domain
MGARKLGDKSSIGKASQTAAISTESYSQHLERAIAWLLNDGMFANLSTHGNTSWQFASLVSLAVLWVWSDQSQLTAKFSHASQLSIKLFGKSALSSFQGLTLALVNKSGAIVPILWAHLHQRMEQVAGKHWRVGKWLPLACDGSYFSTPRTIKNEKAFSFKNYGQGKTSKSRKKWKNKKKRSKPLGAPIKPQIWLTLVWHIGLKMPWCWKMAGAFVKEREHLKSILETMQFPTNTLFCADAGFTGYELWDAILRSGHHFVIRVGANVHLLSKLANAQTRDDLVFLWPNKQARRNQPPIMLRLIKIQDNRGTMYLVTSVLSVRDLSNFAAHRFYKMRWGIEVQFRSVKQTFGKKKLKSRTPENALVELEWSLVGLWFIQLLAAKEQIKIGNLPQHSSVALALHAIHEAIRSCSDPAPSKQALKKSLSQAVTDQYKRKSRKSARYKPNYKDQPSRGKPTIRKATKAQRAHFGELAQAA